MHRSGFSMQGHAAAIEVGLSTGGASLIARYRRRRATRTGRHSSVVIIRSHLDNGRVRESRGPAQEVTSSTRSGTRRWSPLAVTPAGSHGSGPRARPASRSPRRPRVGQRPPAPALVRGEPRQLEDDEIADASGDHSLFSGAGRSPAGKAMNFQHDRHQAMRSDGARRAAIRSRSGPGGRDVIG
jgi:hypothetical protein